MSSGRNITLVGAGLVGSLLAIYLARRRYAVEVYERRPDMRTVDISAGRSINLALSRRGIHALEQVGLQETVMQLAIPMKGRMVHALDGDQTFVPYGQKESEVINSVSRAELNKVLMEAAEASEVIIRFNERCTGIDFERSMIAINDETSNQVNEYAFDRIIGTDGSASAIRDAMMATRAISCSREELAHGYKELSIPADANGNFKLDANALHIWPRGAYMLIALPNLDGSFTCTLFFPMHGEKSFEALRTEESVQTFFEAEFPDAVPLMPTLLDDFFGNPTGQLATIRCYPWHYRDKACLLGDAAHAIVPFFGQGMNCGFEDCFALNACLSQFQSWERVFVEFDRTRKVDADAIAELSLNNYLEMRDHVADPKFTLKREIEFALERKFPDRFIPKYSMVSFHRIPYSVALRRGRVQERILDELTRDIDAIDDMDWDLAEQLVAGELEVIRE